MHKIQKLILSGQTVFNLQDLSVYWQINDQRQLTELVKYYIRSKALIHIRRGLYALKKDYSELEVAQKLIPLSYITFHTALGIHGINFQYHTSIHSSSLQSRNIAVENVSFVYHKIPEAAFYNDLGLIKEKNYTIVTPERAFCESLLFAKNMGFDHMDSINMDLVVEISKIYNNKALEDRVKTILKKYI